MQTIELFYPDDHDDDKQRNHTLKNQHTLKSFFPVSGNKRQKQYMILKKIKSNLTMLFKSNLNHMNECARYN
ncbi:hypothetical protein DERP_001419 [Dermatophagoides pteronyssinus]|uniref:Uncharacterized protein n=1 Tax=Dermatophagoides pteronyssinus TaxID=6956 RepID=A0ABQ8JED9_DERPT|nr:hypothetical protein DERP_001419 [Dermatophagoides pteronyssinus]